jgi:signal transduction histidine kinase
MAYLTAFGAVAMTVLAAALRLGIVGPGQQVDSADDLLPVLVSAAFLCVVGLAWRRHRSVAWLATIGAAFVVTIEIATYARDALPVDVVAWQWLGVAISLAALLAVATAAAYGFGRPRFAGGRFGVPAAVVATLAVSGIAVWAIANSDPTLVDSASPPELGSLGLVTRTFLVLTPLFTALGVVGDLLPAGERAWRRVALTNRTSTSRADLIGPWTQAFADELAPGRSRARQAVLAERSRVARDIHADVVPSLRHALAAAERGDSADELANRLRVALADVEAIGAAQHPIQLDVGGLVAALEWLAERVERQSTLTITLDVTDPPPDAAGEPPAEVAASAFRIAQLALNNVAWHAEGCPAAMSVRAGRTLVDLAITDEGPGIDAAALDQARENGRRGLADMAAEAAAVGGELDVASGPGGVGTTVTFRWRAADGR